MSRFTLLMLVVFAFSLMAPKTSAAQAWKVKSSTAAKPAPKAKAKPKAKSKVKASKKSKSKAKKPVIEEDEVILTFRAPTE